MLDNALKLVISVEAESQAKLAFVRRWSLGRAPINVALAQIHTP